MGKLTDKILGDRQAVADHKAAKQALHNNHDTDETDEYVALNQRVIDTEQRVPWWRR